MELLPRSWQSVLLHDEPDNILMEELSYPIWCVSLKQKSV